MSESLDAGAFVGAVTLDQVGGLVGEGWQTVKVLENADNIRVIMMASWFVMLPCTR